MVFGRVGGGLMKENVAKGQFLMVCGERRCISGEQLMQVGRMGEVERLVEVESMMTGSI